MNTLIFSDKQVKKLLDILENDDTGPLHEGWRSDELIELHSSIEMQLKEQSE